MTVTPANLAPAPRSGQRTLDTGHRRNLIWAHIMLAAAATIAALLYPNLRLVWEALRADTLQREPTAATTLILSGTGAVICLAGAMALLNRVLTPNGPAQPRPERAEGSSVNGPPWYLRLPLALYQRLLLVVQLILTAAVLLAATTLIFDLNFPRTPAPHPTPYYRYR